MAYLNNATLLAEYNKSKTAGRISPGLARYFLALAENMAKRANFRGYSFRDDMIGEALEHLVKGWHHFNPAKTSNAFGYYSQVVYAAMVRVIKREGRQGQIRDELLNAHGLRGSAGHEIDREAAEGRVDSSLGR